MNDDPKVFVPHVEYWDGGWWATVSVEGYSPGYWRRHRFTRWGAMYAAKRQAAKLTRLQAEGVRV